MKLAKEGSTMTEKYYKGKVATIALLVILLAYVIIALPFSVVYCLYILAIISAGVFVGTLDVDAILDKKEKKATGTAEPNELVEK